MRRHIGALGIAAGRASSPSPPAPPPKAPEVPTAPPTASAPPTPPTPSAPKIPDVAAQIQKTPSQAYEIVRSLTDEVGPRLSGSAGEKAAIAWGLRTLN